MAQPNQTVLTPSVGAVKVWILPVSVDGNGNSSFPWSLGFVEETRLIPNSAQKGIRGGGSASFRLLRSLRDDGNGYTNLPGNVVVGAYCCITIGTSAFNYSNVVWWGYIKTIQSVELTGGIDTIGTVTAGGIGEIIDGTTADYLYQGTSGGSPSQLFNPPSFNLSTDAGEIIGNKVIDGSGIPVFASTSAQCGTFWSRSDILTHVLYYAAPLSIPALTLGTSAGLTTYLSDTSVPELFEPRGQTLGNLLELPLSRANGFSWDVIPNNAGGWTIYAYATNDNAGQYDPLYPAQSPVTVDVTGSQVMDVGFSENSDDLIDSVTVEGAPIVFMASVSYADGNLNRGWNTTQETGYRAGGSTNSGYSAMTPVQKADFNQQIREGAEYRDVFELFTVDLTKDAQNPAGQNGGSVYPLVPALNFNGTNIILNTGGSNVPYMPRVRLCRTLPWQVGIKADGTDTRTTAQKAQPTYLEPRLFVYNSSGTPQTYTDLMVDSGYGEAVRHAPSLTMDDRSPGFRIRFSPKEILANGHWTSGTDAVCKLPMGGGSGVSGAYDNPADNVYGRCISPESIVATVAYQSDQRVNWVNLRGGITSASQVRRNITINAEHLQVWYVINGAIIGIDPSTGADDYVRSDTITRNDWKTVKHLCDLYAAWYFRKRTAVVIKYSLPGNLPGWCSIGTLVGQIIERSGSGGGTALDVNAFTVVESIAYDFNGEPSATISTSLPPAPSFGGGQVSPSMGGSISASLGTTPALAIQRGQASDMKAAGDAQRRPSIPARTTPYNATNATMETVIAPSHGFTVGQVIRNGALFNGALLPFVSDVGLITNIYDGNKYDVYYHGFVYNYAPTGALIPTAGQTAFLSATTSGAYVFTYASSGLKIFDAISATRIYVNPSYTKKIYLNQSILTSGSSFTVPAGVYSIKAILRGPGANGSSNTTGPNGSTYAGGGGGAGGYAETEFPVTPGASISYQIGLNAGGSSTYIISNGSQILALTGNTGAAPSGHYNSIGGAVYGGLGGGVTASSWPYPYNGQKGQNGSSPTALINYTLSTYYSPGGIGGSGSYFGGTEYGSGGFGQDSGAAGGGGPDNGKNGVIVLQY